MPLRSVLLRNQILDKQMNVGAWIMPDTPYGVAIGTEKRSCVSYGPFDKFQIPVEKIRFVIMPIEFVFQIYRKVLRIAGSVESAEMLKQPDLKTRIGNI